MHAAQTPTSLSRSINALLLLRLIAHALADSATHPSGDHACVQCTPSRLSPWRQRPALCAALTSVPPSLSVSRRPRAALRRQLHRRFSTAAATSCQLVRYQQPNQLLMPPRPFRPWHPLASASRPRFSHHYDARDACDVHARGRGSGCPIALPSFNYFGSFCS